MQCSLIYLEIVDYIYSVWIFPPDGKQAEKFYCNGILQLCTEPVRGSLPAYYKGGEL